MKSSDIQITSEFLKTKKVSIKPVGEGSAKKIPYDR